MVICKPIGSSGNNKLLSFGLSYTELTQIQDLGLIQHDLSAWRQMLPSAFTLTVKVGAEKLRFELTEKSPKEKVQMDIINFTTVGFQLRRAMALGSNAEYNKKFVD